MRKQTYICDARSSSFWLRLACPHVQQLPWRRVQVGHEHYVHGADATNPHTSRPDFRTHLDVVHVITCMQGLRETPSYFVLATALYATSLLFRTLHCFMPYIDFLCPPLAVFGPPYIWGGQAASTASQSPGDEYSPRMVTRHPSSDSAKLFQFSVGLFRCTLASGLHRGTCV